MATTLPAANEQSATSRPYSTAVAPDSSRMKLRTSVITAGHSPPIASGVQEITQAFNERCSDIVDRRERTGGASGNRQTAKSFPQRLHEFRPPRLRRCKGFISDGAKVVGND